MHHGEGFAQAVTDSDFEANLRNAAMSALSKGLVLGLKENANLSASSLELSAKVAEGAALKIANREDNVQDGEEKRKSELSDMLLGFKDGISSCANLTDSEKESFLKNFTNSARVSIQNSNHAELNEHFADVAGEALNKKDKELHIITVYEPSSARWVGSELIKGDPSASVNIANGDKEIVLVLSSYETVNWSISGAIARVSKVIAIGYHAISVNGVDPAIVENHSYELNGSYQGNYCGTGSDWPYDPIKIATQAFAICMRDIQGYQISSMQGQYGNNSFVVGDGLNLPPKFRAYSMDLPWYYAESLIGNILGEAKGSETSGEVVFVIKFVKAPLVSTIINAKVVHGTTDANDFVALETKVTVYPGSSMAFVRLPIKQDGILEGPESFKIILSSDQKINFLTPVLNGTIAD